MFPVYVNDIRPVRHYIPQETDKQNFTVSYASKTIFGKTWQTIKAHVSKYLYWI